MASKLGLEGDLVFTGGVAKNEGMRHALAHEMNRPVLIPPNDPQLIGALGAALFAKELIMK